MAIVEVVMKRFALLPVLFPGVLGVSRSWLTVSLRLMKSRIEPRS